MKLVKKQLFPHLKAALLRKAYVSAYWKIPGLLPDIKNPEIIEVELTNDCNMGCLHCHRTLFMKRAVGFMEFETFKKIVDEIAQYPVKFLRICGQGEPSLHPQFREIMAYASGKDIKIEITTNGEIFELFPFEEILRWDIDIIGVSVDGIDGPSYNKIRKGGDYDRLKQNITGFYEFRNRANKKYPMLCVRNVILPSYTPQQIENFNLQWGKSTDQVTHNTFHDIIQKSSTQGYNRCTDIFFYAHFNFDGSIRQCAYGFLYGSHEKIGNIKNDSIRNMWNSQTMRNLRWRHYKKDFPEVCKKCHETSKKHVGHQNSRIYNTSKNGVVKLLNRVINIT
ncbi:radical SAM protein [Rhodocytophaga rosea]|uniref:Radical SAM protein n=1 Tax=Rhodocytophaga rosea TaxID=2704465 RepID=A0A6C0GC05_9BACT|nr:radical SAM protein [Rhodocytophaga rosea]QHT65471.1 radical SAM protein [Rhodocytophaga rosea]